MQTNAHRTLSLRTHFSFLGNCLPELARLSALHIATDWDEWVLGLHQVVLWWGRRE